MFAEQFMTAGQFMAKPIHFEFKESNMKKFNILILLLVIFAIMTVLVSCAGEQGTDGLEYYELPDGNFAVGVGAAKYLEKIVIPSKYSGKSVTEIDVDGFKDSINLKEIVIPNSVTSIGSSAFSGCTSITKIEIPNRITRIDNEVFYNCTNLIEIVIPNSVTSIGDSAFSGCTSLAEIELPNGITRIYNKVFYNCKNLTEIVIPNGVMSIGNDAFYECFNLKIYCEAKSRPKGWELSWSGYSASVVWGYKK